jgi:hypothetical protein
MPMPRYGIAGAVIGNEFHLVSGMIQSAGALSFLDLRLEVHTGEHDVLELNFFFPTPATGAKKDVAPPSEGAKNVGGLLLRCCEQRNRDFFFRSSEERKRNFYRGRKQRV